MKVLHCPNLVGGNPGQLSRAERELGLDSYSIAQYQNYLQYRVDEVLGAKGYISGELARWRWALIKSADFDVIHYNAGSSILPMRVDSSISRGGIPRWFRKLYNLFYAGWTELLDLKIAALRKQVIAVTYQGDDARQGQFCRDHYPIHFVSDVEPGYYSDDLDEIKRERINRFDEIADLIYALNPDLLNVLPARAKFLPYACVDINSWHPSVVERDVSTLNVVHAPSHRGVKGTKYILDAVNRLQSEGVEFQFTLVEGISNEDAKKIYQHADLLIDQLLAGFYGALSVEFMALAKPVVSYLREDDLHFLPNAMVDEMPIINANPSSIYDVLKYWLTEGRDGLVERGMAGRRFVEQWHDPLKIASQLKQDYETAMREKGRR